MEKMDNVFKTYTCHVARQSNDVCNQDDTKVFTVSLEKSKPQGIDLTRNRWCLNSCSLLTKQINIKTGTYHRREKGLLVKSQLAFFGKMHGCSP